MPLDAEPIIFDVCGERLFESGEGGIRTTLEIPVNSALLEDRAAKSDALAITDPGLLHVVRAWPDLPDPIRLAVVALVRSRLA